MNIHYLASKTETRLLDTEELRDNFLLDGLFEPSQIQLAACDIDRAIVGSACPVDESLPLEAPESMRAAYFCERRELGVLNLGEAGSVTVDGESHDLGNRECLYIGRGSKEIAFVSSGGSKPQFYLLSYPAHMAYPTCKAGLGDANRLALGSGDSCNERVIYQYIHENGIRSCQLVMGFTELAKGSVWNTMPAHTHDRRSEVYLYFDIPETDTVLHLMGEPQETRHICVHDRQAVLSPAWSIHAGCGTTNYCFVWGMGGENQRFDDMDPAPIADLR